MNIKLRIDNLSKCLITCWLLVLLLLLPSAVAYGQSYTNGFATDVSYEPATQISGGDFDGYYEIDNGGKLFWFAQYVNSQSDGNVVANAVVTCDIDLEGRSFPGIGKTNAKCFSGVFDGQNHTISNFYQIGQIYRTGLFSTVKGSAQTPAVVKNFTLTGTKTVSTTNGMQGSVAGEIEAYATLFNVNSTVNITCSVQATLVGGFVGCINKNGTVDRCRYHGTLASANSYDRIGGLAGVMRGGQLKNSLFDGEITNTSNSGSLVLGGLVGKTENADGSKISNCLSHGTITLAGSNGTVGQILGSADKKVVFSNVFYRNSPNTLPKVGAANNNATGVDDNITLATAESLTDGSVLIILGEDDWVAGAAYPYPGQGLGHNHYDHCDSNGFCTMHPEWHMPATQDTEDYWLISNGSQMHWFADYVNGLSGDGTAHPDANAKLTCSIDMDCDNHAFAGIGSSANPYSGTFNGQNYTISGYKRTSSATIATGFGFFNNTSGAHLCNLTLQGGIYITGADNKSPYIGALVGRALNTVIEDVTSSVSIQTDATITGTEGSGIRIVGGLVAEVQGCTINRCRYNGTMTLNAQTDVIGDRFGGIVGYAQVTPSTISNCLFDGEIVALKNSIIIGGIIARGLNNTNVSISNCLSVGTLNLTTVNTNCGPIVGSGGTVTMSYYTLDGFTAAGAAVTSGYNTAGTPKGSLTWQIIHQNLGSGNWKTVQGLDYPVPGENTNTHQHNYVNGFCTSLEGECDARKEQPSLVSGIYVIANAGQLFYFAESVNDGTYPRDSKASLSANIDMEGSNHTFTGIHEFQGTFDGDGHTITNFYLSSSNTSMIAFIGQATGAEITDFTISGQMAINCSTPRSEFGSIVGRAGSGTVMQDVTSSVTVVLNGGREQSVGGLVGRMDVGSLIDRCRYNGTIQAGNAYNMIGGLVGENNGGEIRNCLFDGTITFSTPGSDIVTGGLVGYWSGSDALLNNSLSHGSITLPAGTHTKAGLVIGFAENKTIKLTRILFTRTGGLTDYLGTASSGCTVQATPHGYPLDVTVSGSCESLYNGKAHAILGESNWLQDGHAVSDYPYPGTGGPAHVHSWTENGFCIALDDVYQPIDGTDFEGYYQVTNAGQLWWVAQQINSGGIPSQSNVKLMNDIDMEGQTYGSFTGIGAYGQIQNGDSKSDDWSRAFQGIFDGKGHTINNYYRSASGVREGLFNVTRNATIKNFAINGSFVITGTVNANGALEGAVVGHASGATLIEDINCSVNISASGARGLGGIAGCLDDGSNKSQATINRCRYNGTITLAGTTYVNTGIGGICGEMRSGTVTNSLFDGIIIAAQDIQYKYVGGITGVCQNNSNNEIYRTLTHGSISLASFTEETNQSAIVVGCIKRNLHLDKCYYTTTNTGTLPSVGRQISVDSEGVESVVNELLLGTATDVTGQAILTDGTLRSTLGEPNWGPSAPQAGVYPYPLLDDSHIHKYSNGFCTSGDGEYQKPNVMGTTYQISNGGNLYWFAEQFNEGNIPQDATVEIMADIDMEGTDYTFPGIGSSSYPFTGVFDGHGYRISNFYRALTKTENNGLINYAQDAIIKKFILEGTMDLQFSSVKSFHGTVVGCALGDNMLIEDVTSKVHAILRDENTRVFGGIAGRATGTINRCTFEGAIIGVNNQPTGSGNQIAGICANAKGSLTISNCLFDGIIKSTSAAQVMQVSGFLAANEKNTGVDITIINCLFNGCLMLEHAYEGTDGSTQNGIIAGYLDTHKPSLFNNIVCVTTCPDDMAGLPVGNYEYDDKHTDTDVESVVDPNWKDVFEQLEQNEGNDWQYEADPQNPNNPRPNSNVCDPHVYDQFGYCTRCGASRPIVKDEDGKYKMEVVSDIASFRDMVNRENDGSEMLHAKLTQDIDFAEFSKEFGDPIGNDNFCRYLYEFDGQGYTMKNLVIRTDKQFAGLFGFAGDDAHQTYIHDLNIYGTIEAPYADVTTDDDRHQLFAGVVGEMYNGVIENVHCYMTIQNVNETRATIGGILGSAKVNESNTVVIRNCSFNGQIVANAFGDFGGIVGHADKGVTITDCAFHGSIVQDYAGVQNMSTLGGIVGYNISTGFGGINNSIVTGSMSTNKSIETEHTEYNNNWGVLIGYDTMNESTVSGYGNNLAAPSAYDSYVQYPQSVKSTVSRLADYSMVVDGTACAQLNSTSTYALWGQILGYQVSGNHTDGSPAMEQPLPGWNNPGHNTYKVVKDAQNNYLADWYYFDDAGDATPFPANASTFKAKKIEYHRAPEYLTGYNSFVLPFEFTQEMKPNAESRIFTFNRVIGTTVAFTELTQGSMAAGTPFILYCNSNDEWDWVQTDPNGIDITMSVTNPVGIGLYGSFNTILTGSDFWKINNDGTELVKTVEESSHCYPYRGYLKLTQPSLQPAPLRSYVPVFGLSKTLGSDILNGSLTPYTIQGIPAEQGHRGFVIIDGKKYLITE